MILPRNRVKRLVVYNKFLLAFGFRFIKSFFMNRRERSICLFGRTLRYTNRFWLLHSLEEIFIDKVYLFHSAELSPRIIDCGANIGLSVIFFKRTFPSAKIIAFEPD